MSGNPRRPPLVLWTWISVAVLVASLLALTALQYVMPDNAESPYGLNQQGMRMFQQQFFGHQIPGMDVRAYTLSFRLLLSILWMSYVAIVILALRGGLIKTKTVCALMMLISVLLAILWPASLSFDPFTYIAYARIGVIHGQNPYACEPHYLSLVKDPTAQFAPWNQRTPWGPVWVLVCMLIVKVMHNVGLVWQVIAVKLLGAGALIVAALAGRSIARHFSPNAGDVALPAIGLNPLFLVEGPASGHNDLPMMSLLLVGISLFLKKRYFAASLLFGLSIGIKYVTILILPWAIMECCRGRPFRQKVWFSTAMASLSAIPTVLCFLPFRHGSSAFAGLYERWLWSASLPGGKGMNGTDWMQAATHGSIVRALGLQLVLIPLFACLSWWFLCEKAANRWLAAWVIFSLGIVLVVTGVWFPWYLIWPMAVSLAWWDRLHIRLSALCLVVAFLLSMLYTVAPLR